MQAFNSIVRLFRYINITRITFHPDLAILNYDKERLCFLIICVCLITFHMTDVMSTYIGQLHCVLHTQMMSFPHKE